MSLAINLSLCSRCLANSGSGQWRSITNICRASSFQNKSSEVAEPLLQRESASEHEHTFTHRGHATGRQTFGALAAMLRKQMTHAAESPTETTSLLFSCKPTKYDQKDDISRVLQQVLVVSERSCVVSVSRHSTGLKRRQMDVPPPSPLRTGYTATHGNARRHRHPSVQRPARMTAMGGREGAGWGGRRVTEGLKQVPLTPSLFSLRL